MNSGGIYINGMDELQGRRFVHSVLVLGDEFETFLREGLSEKNTEKKAFEHFLLCLILLFDIDIIYTCK